MLFGPDNVFISSGLMAPANTASPPYGGRDKTWEYELVLNPDLVHHPTISILSEHGSEDFYLADFIVKEYETCDRAINRERSEYFAAIKVSPLKCFHSLKEERTEEFFPIQDQTAVEALRVLFAECDTTVVSEAELSEKKLTMSIREQERSEIFRLILMLYNVRVVYEKNQLVVVPEPKPSPKIERYFKYSELTKGTRHSNKGQSGGPRKSM